MRSIYQGKAEDVLPQFPDACFDALVLDPPSSIHFMSREWDSNRGGRTQWVAWLAGILKEAMRTLKPGGYGLIWSLPRTSHWTATALEDARWEVKDCITHITGQGFPKGLNVSKSLMSLPWCTCGCSKETSTRTEDRFPIVPVHENSSAMDASPSVSINGFGADTLSMVERPIFPFESIGAREGTALIPNPRNGSATNDARGLRNELNGSAGHGSLTMQNGIEDTVGDFNPVVFGSPDVAIMTTGDKITHDVSSIQAQPEALRDEMVSNEGTTSSAVSTDLITSDNSIGNPTPRFPLVGPSASTPSGVAISNQSNPIVDSHTGTGAIDRVRVSLSNKTGKDSATNSTCEGGSATSEFHTVSAFEQDSLSVRATPIGTILSSGSTFEADPTILANFGTHESIIRRLIAENKVLVCANCKSPVRPEWIQDGIGTTLKPAVEFWWLVRKPPAESTIAKQVLATGTGALNIDACRVKADGRWPANLILSHSEECVPLDRATLTENRRTMVDDTGIYKTDVYEGGPRRGGAVRGYGDDKDAPAWQCIPECPIAVLDAQSGIRTSGKSDGFDGPYKADVYGKYARNMIRPETIYGDTGGASRYFTTLPYEAPFIYLPKASPADRTMRKQVKNGHQTIKSTALMAWLCTLITPPGGTILDCFMGSGSTLIAAERLGFSWVGIDESPEYCETARARLATLGVEVEINAQDAPAPIAPVQPRIRYHVGSIFEVDAQVLVNPVNCQGILGKGLARQFKERFPEMVATYREDCRTRKLALGHPRLYKGSTPWVLNLPTKDAWTAPSRLEYIEQSLQYIAAHYQQVGITNLVFPKLGCGAGGLSWDDVGPLMAKYLSAISADVTICIGENDIQYQEGDAP